MTSDRPHIGHMRPGII